MPINGSSNLVLHNLLFKIIYNSFVYLPKIHVLGSLLEFGINLDDILGFRQSPLSIHLFSHLWKMVPFHCGLGWASFKDLYINIFATFD